MPTEIIGFWCNKQMVRPATMRKKGTKDNDDDNDEDVIITFNNFLGSQVWVRNHNNNRAKG